jgi:proton-translocating NADH-quinone oxidoreductase chain N
MIAMFEPEITFLIFILLAAFMLSSIANIFMKKKKAQYIISTIILLLIAICSVYLLAVNYNAEIANMLHIYPFSLLFILLFSIAMALVNTLTYAYSKDYNDVSLLLSFSFAGMLAVAAASSIITIFIGLELVGVTTSFMILFDGKSRIEAAVKFFILSSISIAIFSFALALLLPYSPQLALAPASTSPNITGGFMIILSLIFFVAVFGFDTAQFPFNLWIPDVYEGSPGYITALLSGINKKVAFVALIEVFFLVFYAYSHTFSLIFMGLAVLTMFIGNIIALTQKSVKRLFAYSSIAQAGYIIIGIATASQFGLEASIFYIIAHSFMIIGAFAIVLWLESKNIKTIDEYAGLNGRNKFAAASLTILMLSMAGIPPLIGFAGKFLLFSSALNANLVGLAVIGIINSFISIYYYAKVINAMYSRKEEKALRMDYYIAAVVIVCLAVIIIFGIYPQPVISVAANASKAIFGI